MTGSLSILLAEDYYPDVLYTRNLLERGRVPHSLHICADGEQALNFLRAAAEGRERLPDLALLDIKMPKYSGLEVLEIIREIPQLKDLPVVVVTGSDDPDDLRRVSQLRASYIMKPADFEKLCRVLSALEHACQPLVSDKPDPFAPLQVTTNDQCQSEGAEFNVVHRKPADHCLEYGEALYAC